MTESFESKCLAWKLCWKCFECFLVLKIWMLCSRCFVQQIRELEPVSTAIRQQPCVVPPSHVQLFWGSLPADCVFPSLISAQLSFRFRCSDMLLLGAVQPFISTPGGSWDYWVGKTGVMAQLLSVTSVADEIKKNCPSRSFWPANWFIADHFGLIYALSTQEISSGTHSKLQIFTEPSKDLSARVRSQW